MHRVSFWTPRASSWRLQMMPHWPASSRTEFKKLAVCFSLNNLELNTIKTVKMILDFRRNPSALPHSPWTALARHLLHRAVVHWQAIIKDESHSIMNTKLSSLSVNYSSIVLTVLICVLTAPPFESSWWRFTANHATGFTDEMRLNIACD